MRNNQCPYCGRKINYIRKLLFYSSLYAKECPYCKQKIKIKNLGYKFGIGILIFVIILGIIFKENTFIKTMLLILYILFALIGTYFLKYYPDDIS